MHFRMYVAYANNAYLPQDLQHLALIPANVEQLGHFRFVAKTHNTKLKHITES